MEPTQDQLPPDVSLDFSMTEKTLWGVWCGRDEVLRLIGGAAEISFRWWLADSFEQIVERSDSLVLAGISLEGMKKNVALLSEKAPWWKPLPKTVFVKRGETSFWTEKVESGDKELLSGNLSDLKRLADEGESILVEKKYKDIFFDIRPLSPGHPVDWLSFMRNPTQAFNFRATVKEYGFEGLRAKTED